MYTIEPPLRGGFNAYPQFMFWIKIKKNRNTLKGLYIPDSLYKKLGLRGFTFHGLVVLVHPNVEALGIMTPVSLL